MISKNSSLNQCLQIKLAIIGYLLKLFSNRYCRRLAQTDNASIWTVWNADNQQLFWPAVSWLLHQQYKRGQWDIPPAEFYALLLVNCLFVCEQDNSKKQWTDLHETFMDGWKWATEEKLDFGNDPLRERAYLRQEIKFYRSTGITQKVMNGFA